MKIENLKPAEEGYVVWDDISSGSAFRIVGDKDLYMKEHGDCCYVSLLDGHSYPLDDGMSYIKCLKPVDVTIMVNEN